MKTAIVTDSNSGITQSMAKEMGIYVVPMPVLIDGEQYFEDISLTQEQFYEKLKSDAQVSTSQPSAFDVGELWTKLLNEYDKIIHIPMSSGLSETCHTLAHLAETEYAGKVYVIDNQRISITMRQSVTDAQRMLADGKSAEEIRDFLMETKMQSSIYIMVDTLKYLKKGGRLTPAVAAIGTLLKIKPVLQIQGEKLDQFAKVRKIADAKTTMINAIRHDMETRFKDLRARGKMTLAVAHTQNFEEAEIFADEIKSAFPDVEFTYIDPLSLSVSCHIGPGALAVAATIRY
ncbi:MAG TPA: DegV family protein [Candidatus Coproplasma excrementipullorum]|nr:DegV family protein [Candidatus Coproplasma excrementipullorum]